MKISVLCGRDESGFSAVVVMIVIKQRYMVIDFVLLRAHTSTESVPLAFDIIAKIEMNINNQAVISRY